MSILQVSPPIRKAYPRYDHEGTWIDYRDDPTAWQREPSYGPRRIPLPTYASSPQAGTAFLEDE